MKEKKKCFVIMPFSETNSLDEKKWTEIFEHVIQPAVEDCGLGHECGRYEFRRANITKDILQELNNAHVVIADLTDSNPNVLWELGVRHTLSRRTILIAQDKKFLPSDLKDYPLITYKYKQTPTRAHKFRQDIKEKLKDIETDPEKPDSPVADFLQLKNIDLLSFEKTENLKKLSALISELSYNINATDDILDIVKQSEKRRKKDEGAFTYTTERFSTTCLELLLSTSYVTLQPELLEVLWETKESIRLANNTLEMWPHHSLKEELEGKLRLTLPKLKKVFTYWLEQMAKIKIDYANDNYQEPKEPAILLANPEHEEYLKINK